MPLTKPGALRIHSPLDNYCTGSGMQLHPKVLQVRATCQGPVSSGPGASTHIQLSSTSATNKLSDVPHSNESLSGHESVELVFLPDICKSTCILKCMPQAARHQAASKLAIC